MAKNGVISFYKNEEFNDWLYDIGKKRGLYDSYINTLDEDNKLSSDIKLDDAKKIVDKLLKDVDDKIKTSIGKDKKYNRSRRSGLRSYKRFLSYIPTYYISYTYNGIKELAELFQISNTSLIKYMISHSLFAPPELVRKRAEEIAVLIVNDDKIPARFSTGEKYRNVSTGSKEKFKSRTDGKNKTIQSDFRYIDNEIKVQIDSNGNYTICDYLATNTSINITSGDKRRNCYGYMISHIWGNATDPLFFSNFWNIVLIPQFVSFILDKGDEMASIKYAKDLYKAIAYVLYEKSIGIINDALTKAGKKDLGKIEPDEDIKKDAKDIIKKTGIKYIP